MNAPGPSLETASLEQDELDRELRTRRETDLAVLGICLAVVAAAWMLHVTPDQHGVSLFGVRLPELCAAKRMGTTCPGCGMTRSFVLSVRGDPSAFRLHPLGPLLFAFVVLQLPYRSYWLWNQRRLAGRGERERALRRPNWHGFTLFFGFLIALLVTWVVRVWL